MNYNKPIPGPSFSEVSELLDYAPETGILTWRKLRPGKAKKGSVAGTLNKRGYIRVKIFGKSHAAHHIAWLLSYREWPHDQVDHRNTIRTDNRIENLRIGGWLGNAWNKGKLRNNTSGIKGVYWEKQVSKWRAYPSVYGRNRHLGFFENKEDAAVVVDAFYRENHGDFYHRPHPLNP